MRGGRLIYDFIIVGSGVSGGRVAFELTKSGARCLLLEAGREFDRTSFPDNERDGAAKLFWGGGLELSSDGRLLLLRAKVLGGGSVVNQALMDRFDEDTWSDWRDRTGIAFFDSGAMAPHYDAVESSVLSRCLTPRHAGRNARLFVDGMEANGLQWSALKRAQGECRTDRGSDCIVCLNGCPRDSKQSTPITTLRVARSQGLQVQTGFHVEKVVHESQSVTLCGRQHGHEVEHRARRVVLAAALGNTAILLRSGLARALPALGKGFSCHPQFMAFGFFREPVDAHKGVFQGAKSADPALRKMGVKLESVCCPPIAAALVMPGRGVEHLAAMKRYRYMASLEVAVRDEAAGTVRIDKRGLPVVDKTLTDIDCTRRDAGLNVVRNVLEAAGSGQVIVSRQPFGLHLMGGCRMGTDSETSVVDPEFRVHGRRNISIADSSIFPSAPGINPWLSIGALSHRAAQIMVRS